MSVGVSVVLATYNGERFLAEQLESLAGQTLLPAELIVSDDGSSDSTMAVVEAFANHAPFPVRIVQNPERLGYGANFLSATAIAEGDFIAYCDQDDVWYPQKLQRCTEVLARTGADLLVHRADVIRTDGRVCGAFDQKIVQDEVLEPLTSGPWVVFYGCMMVFRRDLFDLVDVAARGAHTFEYDTLLSHDLWLTFLATSVGRVAKLTDRLVGYRQHGGNATPSIASMTFRRWTSSLGLAADPILARDQTAIHRAKLMETVGSGVDATPETRARAHEAARYWRRIPGFEKRRLDVYAGSSFPSRVVALARLVGDAGYSSTAEGGLGARLLAKDTIAGALGVRRQRSSAP